MQHQSLAAHTGSGSGFAPKHGFARALRAAREIARAEPRVAPAHGDVDVLAHAHVEEQALALAVLGQIHEPGVDRLARRMRGERLAGAAAPPPPGPGRHGRNG